MGMSLGHIAETVALYIFMVGISAEVGFMELWKTLKKPRSLIIGLVAQYGIMPPLGWLVASAAKLPIEHAIGLIAICCCPGGTGSNVMCQMFKADVSLSISLTALSSLMSFLFLPLNLYLYIGKLDLEEALSLNVWDLSKFTLIIVLGTLCGILCDHLSTPLSIRVIRVLGTLATMYLLVAAIVGNALSKFPIWSLEWQSIVAVIVPIVCGHILGLCASLLLSVKKPGAVAVALEVSIQNKFLALGIVSAVLRSHDQANSAKSIPLLYGTFSMVFNSMLCIVYWKAGWTNLPKQASWWAPCQALIISKDTYSTSDTKVASDSPRSKRDEQDTKRNVHPLTNIHSKPVKTEGFENVAIGLTCEGETENETEGEAKGEPSLGSDGCGSECGVLSVEASISSEPTKT